MIVKTGGEHSSLGVPIPLWWLKEANMAGGHPALVVGVYLWHLSGIRGTKKSLIVTHKKARVTLGIGKDVLLRGLDKLEAAGLIITVREPGKNIRVTIVVAPREVCYD